MENQENDNFFEENRLEEESIEKVSGGVQPENVTKKSRKLGWSPFPSSLPDHPPELPS